MLKRLRLHNYKSFLDALIELHPRHLLIGRNNAGKTSLSRAILFLKMLATSSLADAALTVPGGLAELCHWDLRSNKVEIGCDCDLEMAGVVRSFRYNVTLELVTGSSQRRTAAPELRVASEQLKVTGKGLTIVSLIENDGEKSRVIRDEFDGESTAEYEEIPSPQTATILSTIYEQPGRDAILVFRDFISAWVYYSLSPLRMRYSGADIPPGLRMLDVDGGNLSEVLFHLKNMNEGAYRRVIEHVRAVEPSLESILHVPVPNQSPVPFIELKGGRTVSWAGLSDGTLRMLALSYLVQYASLRSENRSHGILAVIEEPENGIFPGLLRTVSDLFDEWAPLSQFVFTSHSPYFIDMFDYRRSAVTVLRRKGLRTELVQPPEAEDTQDPFTLSQEYAAELFS